MPDKTQFGPNEKSLKVLKNLMDQDLFRQEMDASKFAMSVAIKAGIEPDIEKSGGETKWNIGGFDKDNRIRDIIQTFYPEVEEPVRVIEYFINRGFEIIDENIGLSTSVDAMDLINITPESDYPSTD